MVKKIERLNPNRRWNEISLALMDDDGIAAVNASYLDKPRATDVISFAYPPLKGMSGWEGEVVVNVQRAIEEGTRRGDVAKELALYVAHGCDHLSGADDNTAELRRRMRRRELRWLQEIEYRGILDMSVQVGES